MFSQQHAINFNQGQFTIAWHGWSQNKQINKLKKKRKIVIQLHPAGDPEGTRYAN